ncbi:MAG: hypothetical protein RLZZ50_1643 [Verrucomicrobiota bacterium]|jgi:hypothetical protein
MTSPSVANENKPIDAKAAFRLYKGGILGLAGAIAFFIWRNGGDLSLSFLLGLVVLYLAALPALQWAKHGRDWFPAFEITMLTCMAFYAIPLLGGHRELEAYDSDAITEAAGLIVLYLAAANLGFNASRTAPRAPAWATSSLLPDKMMRYLPLGMVFNSVYLYLEIFTSVIPYNIAGSFRALFFGVGIICTFVLSREWGMGRIDARTRGAFVFNLAIQLIFLIAQLYLVRAISLLAIGLIAYSSARRRIPWLVLATTLPVLALLHAGKPDMRRIYWEEKNPMPTVTQLPAFFAEWIGFGLGAKQATENMEDNRSSIFERASLIQMLCLSVDQVPEVRPYLHGQSYTDIPALVIPRFIWPDKPSSLMANIRLGIHFGLVDPDSPFKVSIAFGMISEAYLNFGFIGPPLLGLITGLFFKRAALLSQNVPQLSALGLLMILLTAWSFQAEFVLATWLSSIFQAAVVCIGLPLAYRKFTTG